MIIGQMHHLRSDHLFFTTVETLRRAGAQKKLPKPAPARPRPLQGRLLFLNRVRFGCESGTDHGYPAGLSCRGCVPPLRITSLRW